jgi:hypothetical protein
MVHKAQHNADQHKVPLLTRKTSKPRTKKMFHPLRFFNPKSKTNTSPHKWSHGTIKKEVLNCFLLRTKAAFCTPRHCLLTKLSLVNTTPFLRYQRKILIFKGILAFHAQQLTGVPALKLCHCTYSSLKNSY